MTKGRVAVGKIESWLQKFESCFNQGASKKHRSVAIDHSRLEKWLRIWVFKSSIYSGFGWRFRIV
jgi:hypothetical protein